MAKTEHIAVLGSGSWGTALSLVLGQNAERVTLWGRDQELASQINSAHENPRYLTGVSLPTSVHATTDFAAAAAAPILFSVVPSGVVRSMMARLAKEENLAADAIIVSCSKGIEMATGKTMCSILREELPGRRVAVLSGPNHAEEVGACLATASVVAADDPQVAAQLQEVLLTPWMRPYTSDDMVGIQWGGAVKNVFAIAAGIADGLSLGDNAKSALVTRGLAEMTRLGVALGGRQDTFQGLSGVGDLVATCYSHLSRNYRVGKELGSGRSLEAILADMTMVAEGVTNTESIYHWARNAGARTPVIDEVYRVLYEKKPCTNALRDLLSRDPRPEAEDGGAA